MTDGNAIVVMAGLVPVLPAARLVDRALSGLDGVGIRDKPGMTEET